MTLRTRLCLALLGVCWGLHVVLTKAIGAESLREALTYLVIYMAATAGGLMLLCAALSRLRWPSRRHLVFFSVGLVLGYLGPVLVELLVAPKLDAGLLALIAAASPIVTLAIAVPARAARLTPRVGLALALGCAAALTILGPSAALGGAALGGAALGWVLAGFLLPVLYGVDNVYVQVMWPKDLDSFQVAAGESVLGLAAAAGIALAAGVGPADQAGAAAAAPVPIAGLAVVSVGSVWLYFHLVHTAGTVAVSFAGFVTIGTGVVLGFLLFEETPGLWTWAACALTVAALWVLRDTRAAAEPARA